MPFTDVIDSYVNGATGTLTTSDGGSVGYTVTANVNTITRPGTDQGAQVTGDGSETVEVAFDQAVHGMTISVNRSNPGEVYFIEVDGVVIDLNDAIADGTVVFSQGGAATHEITASGGITSTGGPTNGSIGFLHFESPVTNVRIFGMGAGAGNWDLFEIGIDSDDFRVVCFAADTRLQTAQGQVPVSQLRAGDRVMALDGSVHCIQRTNARHISAIAMMRETRLAPVHIQAGALGHGLPTHDLRVSRQHRVLVASRIAKRITGHAAVLIPAVRLVGLPGIDIDRSMTPISYYHVLLDHHDLLIANGAPAESLFLGAVTHQALAGEPNEVAPHADAGHALQNMPPAYPFPSAQDCKKVIAAHLRHERPLLEELENLPGKSRGVTVASGAAAPN